ncbi:hypothetical protein [Pseudomonas umsongensis]|uniref:hypothetical protein n=1 Tax=Pseudomonas umsongensis TaxID=198618 RepID=UPI00200B8BDC|nr:hypothetical protein [Pseudomonas umsongensis]MCK8685346.1 hypothetical protein [Pseudomonas umsongensis]
MNASKGFKLIAGLMMVIAATAYSQTVDHAQGGVVFLMSGVTFLIGYFAGEDI